LLHTPSQRFYFQEGYEARLRSVTAAAGERSAEVEVLEARLADEVARAQGLERELEAAAAQQRRAQEIVAAQVRGLLLDYSHDISIIVVVITIKWC